MAGEAPMLRGYERYLFWRWAGRGNRHGHRCEFCCWPLR